MRRVLALLAVALVVLSATGLSLRAQNDSNREDFEARRAMQTQLSDLEARLKLIEVLSHAETGVFQPDEPEGGKWELIQDRSDDAALYRLRKRITFSVPFVRPPLVCTGFIRVQQNDNYHETLLRRREIVADIDSVTKDGFDVVLSKTCRKSDHFTFWVRWSASSSLTAVQDGKISAPAGTTRPTSAGR